MFLKYIPLSSLVTFFCSFIIELHMWCTGAAMKLLCGINMTSCHKYFLALCCAQQGNDLSCVGRDHLVLEQCLLFYKNKPFLRPTHTKAIVMYWQSNSYFCCDIRIEWLCPAPNVAQMSRPFLLSQKIELRLARHCVGIIICVWLGCTPNDFISVAGQQRRPWILLLI